MHQYVRESGDDVEPLVANHRQIDALGEDTGTAYSYKSLNTNDKTYADDPTSTKPEAERTNIKNIERQLWEYVGSKETYSDGTKRGLSNYEGGEIRIEDGRSKAIKSGSLPTSRPN